MVEAGRRGKSEMTRAATAAAQHARKPAEIVSRELAKSSPGLTAGTETAARAGPPLKNWLLLLLLLCY